MCASHCSRNFIRLSSFICNIKNLANFPSILRMTVQKLNFPPNSNISIAFRGPEVSMFPTSIFSSLTHKDLDFLLLSPLLLCRSSLPGLYEDMFQHYQMTHLPLQKSWDFILPRAFVITDSTVQEILEEASPHLLSRTIGRFSKANVTVPSGSQANSHAKTK